MQRFVSLATFAASFPTVLILLRLPMNVGRRIAAAPEAFIDAIERFAKR